MIIDFLNFNYLNVPLWNWGLQILAMFFSYYGAALNAKLNIKGFYFWLISNIMLAILHIYASLWILLILDLLYFRINLIGLKNWSKNNKSTLPKIFNKLFKL